MTVQGIGGPRLTEESAVPGGVVIGNSGLELRHLRKCDGLTSHRARLPASSCCPKTAYQGRRRWSRRSVPGPRAVLGPGSGHRPVRRLPCRRTVAVLIRDVAGMRRIHRRSTRSPAGDRWSGVHHPLAGQHRWPGPYGYFYRPGPSSPGCSSARWGGNRWRRTPAARHCRQSALLHRCTTSTGLINRHFPRVS